MRVGIPLFGVLALPGRIIFAGLVLATAHSALASTGVGQVGQDERPNIVLLVADDLGYSDLGVYGSEIATPSIDALANTGMLFTNFHASPSCSPTRAMLLTGVDHHLAGLGNMKELMADNQQGRPGYEGHLNNRVVSVARLLRDSGYHTYMAGKWHLGSGPGMLPRDRGFERSFAMLEGSGNHFNDGGILPLAKTHYVSDGQSVHRPKGFSTDLYTDKLIEFLKADSGDGQPFFVYAAYTAPHWPLQAPTDDIEPYKDRYEPGWDVLRSQRFERMKRLGLIHQDLQPPPRWNGVPAWDSLSVEEQKIQARKMAVYAGMVKNLDHNVGRLIAWLRETNQLENTLIVFISDNGADAADLESRLPAGMSGVRLWVYRAWLRLFFDNSLENLGAEDSFFSYALPWAQLSSTPLFLHKGLVSEGGTRVPMLVSYPGAVTAESRSNALTTVMDLVPTFLELAGVEHPAQFVRHGDTHQIQGRSLLAILKGDDNAARSRRILGFEFIGNEALIRDDWKIYRIGAPYYDGKWRLVNLHTDPRELEDLSQQYPDRLAEMQRLYLDYAEQQGVIPVPADYFDDW